MNVGEIHRMSEGDNFALVRHNCAKSGQNCPCKPEIIVTMKRASHRQGYNTSVEVVHNPLPKKVAV